MELTMRQAAEIAERAMVLTPALVEVCLSDDPLAGECVRLFVELGNPAEPDLARLAEQLLQLREFLEAEGLKVYSGGSIRLTLSHRDAN